MALLPGELDADTIVLKRLAPEHIDEMAAAAAASFAQLHQWMTWAEDVPTRVEVADFVRVARSLFDDNVAWAFAMIERSSGEIVGCESCERRVVRRDRVLGALGSRPSRLRERCRRP